MSTADDHAELQRDLAALSERFARLAARLADAGQLLVEQQVLPDDTLVAEVRSARLEFDDLHRRAVSMAEALSVPLAAVTDLAGLGAALESLAEAHNGRARPAQEEAARRAQDEAARRAEEHARRAAEEAARREAAEEEARRKAEDEARREAAEEEARRKSELQARHEAEEPARHEAEEAARRKAEEEARRRSEQEARRRAEDAARKRAEGEAAQPAAAAEESADDLGLETAQWWISASAAWGNLKSRQVALSDAIRDVLAKYPYVFSVPVQTSADYEDGLLAYGFAVLLEYLDQQLPGFVSEALNRLPVRKGATLGRRLYDYLAEPLKSRYPEFIKAVLLAGLPKPGLWVNGGLEDTDAATTVFQRTRARIGDAQEKSERLAQDLQRFVDHQFTVAVAPLTSRFFRVEVADAKEPRDVELRLTEKGVPTDLAWVVTVKGREAMPQAQRQDRQGVRITGVGRECAGVWVAVFNADPETEKRFELTAGLRRRGQIAAQSAFRRQPR